MILGALAGVFRESPVGRVVGEQAEGIIEEFKAEVGYGLELVVKVWMNNLTVAVQALGLGLAFGIYPALMLVVNGVVVGYVPFYLASRPGFSAVGYLGAVLPHGVLEFPALVLAATCGLRLGLSSLEALRGPDRLGPFKRAGEDLVGMFSASALLLVGAGLIEGFLSPLVGAGVDYLKLVVGGVLLGLVLRWFSKPKRGRLKL